MAEIATFGAGCFWGVEAAFQRVPGVIGTAVGYSGGEMPNPTYKDVCTDETGHAEVVQVTFDPAKVSYEQLLDVFWQAHDPTQVNRQGPDFGTQYRTAIFFHSPEQEAAAKKSRSTLDASGKFKRFIAPKSITKSIYRSAAWPPATSDRAHDFKSARAEQSYSVFSSRNPLVSTKESGGEGGIRTHGTVSRTLAFEASTFNRSVTSPRWPEI